MVNLIFAALWLLTPVFGANPITAQPGPQVIIGIAGDDAEKVIVHEMNQIPKTWIGVRVTTVPEPLAAHLKRCGLMIANVAEDSPADHAGLERYDVVVSFDGREIESMDDLLAAIKEAGSDRKVELVVIRGGAETSLRIRPVKRKDSQEVTFKYEEPEQEQGDQLQRYFGHRIKVGPDGNAFVIPQGRLDRLPDDIEELLEDLPRIDVDLRGKLGDLYDWEDLPRTFKFDLDDWGKLKWHRFDDLDSRAEIHIRIEDNGETLMIQRSEEGTITIERQDADGNGSSTVYENIDQLREEDPAAYAIYRHYVVGRDQPTFFVCPDFEDLGVQQKEFQLELQRQLDKAREELRKSAENARQTQTHKRFKIRTRENEGEADIHSKTVKIRIDDAGRILLEITEDGDTRKYEFENREDFQESEPELYQRYLEQSDKRPGARSERATRTGIA